jgi:hypothetical protein
MKERPTGGLPPVRRPRRESTWGRWIAGPLIAMVVAAGTAALAHVVLPGRPKPPPPKAIGRLKLNTVPPGASITIDGKVYPHFTPTVVEGEVGSTLHVGFKLDGYETKETDVYLADGERPFSVKLERSAAAPPKPEPEPEPVVVKKERTPRQPKEKEPVGKATISVSVRPWAIVYVDGSRLRQTPVNNFEISSGKHSIELVNEGKNRREKIQLNLKPGDNEEIKRDWDK